jgi:hypothetical protein
MHLRRTFAAIVLLFALLLLRLGTDMLLYGGHAAPGSILFLLPSVLLAVLTVFVWRGHLWAAITTVAVSLVPGVWPLLWRQLTGLAPSPSQVTMVIAGRRLFLPWWEMLLIAAPVLFATFTVLTIFAAKKR